MSASTNIYLDNPDALSVLLTKLSLSAQIYVNADFCGTWAVDTAGSKRIPFHLIGSGSAWLHLEGCSPRLLKAQDLVVFPHDVHHVISNSSIKPPASQVNTPMSNDGDVTQMICGFFEFQNPMLFPVLESLAPAVVLDNSKHDADDRVPRLISLMLTELKNAQAGYYAAIDQMAFLIFIEVLRQEVKEGVLGNGLLPALFDERLGRALNVIHRTPEAPWSLDTLAGEALMGRSSFSEVFHKTVGLTPMKYLTQWRMTQARQLLMTTRLSVEQIAEKSGYESEAAFRKAYKHTLGETPGAVRAKQ